MSEGATVHVACASERAVVLVDGTAKSVPAVNGLSIAVHATRLAEI